MTHVTISDFVSGDTVTLNRPTVTDIPAGRVLAKAWLTIKASETDADPGIIQKIITTALQLGVGQITDVGDGSGSHPVGEGALAFVLSAADTALLSPLKLYYYDIQLQFDNGNLTTPEKGTMQFGQGVTAATS